MRASTTGRWAAAAAVSLAACGWAVGARRVTTRPTTTATALPGPVRLADARPLAELTPGDLQANLTDELSPPRTADRPVYFGEVDAYDGPDEDAKLVSSLPVLAVRDGAAWRAVPVVGPGLADTGWRYVGAGPAKGEAWGVLDTVAGDGGPNFFLAHSTDGGASFALASLAKPCPQAAVFDFAMAPGGRGRVTVAVDEAVGHVKPGLYHYETDDGGRTWSARPRFEADGMTRADPVPDDEQPDPSPGDHKPSKTAWPGGGRRPAVVTVGGPRWSR